MTSSVLSSFRAAVIAAGALGFASLAHAQISFNVTVNTSALTGSMASPLYVDFQLNDGAGWGDANNTAVISNFNFGGGSWFTPATTFGGATGSLSSSITLKDSTAFNEIFQGFAPGAWLSFNVWLSTNVDMAPTPDLFGFAILDSTKSNLHTTAPGNDLFVEVDITQAQPPIWTFSAVGGAVPAPAIVPVPEPSTYGLLGGAALLLGCLYRRRASRR